MKSETILLIAGIAFGAYALNKVVVNPAAKITEGVANLTGYILPDESTASSDSFNTEQVMPVSKLLNPFGNPLFPLYSMPLKGLLSPFNVFMR